MDEGSAETVESSKAPDSLKEKVELCQKTFDFASSYFEAKSSKDNPRYSHLKSVADMGHILLVDDDTWDNVKKFYGLDIEDTQSIEAFYVGKINGILVDSIVIKKDHNIEPLKMLHEFVHRAAAQKELQSNEESFDEQRYQVLDFSKEQREEMKKNSPKEYKATLDRLKRTIYLFNEGLTQWATLYLVNKVQSINLSVEDSTPPDIVSATVEEFESSFRNKGLSKDQIEDLMLDLALTGDFSRIRSALPVGEDLKQHGISSDFYVSLLVTSVGGAYAVKKLKGNLGEQS